MTRAPFFSRRAALTGAASLPLAAASATMADAQAQQRQRRAEVATDSYGEINVLDYGADPTGRTDSTDAINAAIADWHRFDWKKAAEIEHGEGSAAIFKFPPNYTAEGFYRIDGTIDFTSIRGAKNFIDARGAKFYCTNTEFPAFDFTHSVGIVWDGGLIFGGRGDEADPDTIPFCGIQVARPWDARREINPSSHKMRFNNMAIEGEWRRAAFYNFASEMLYLDKCKIENAVSPDDAPGAYAIMQDGRSRRYNAISRFRGDPNDGFKIHIEPLRSGFDSSLFFHVDILRPNGGPAMFLCGGQGHRYHRLLLSVSDAPQIEVFQEASDRRGLLDVLIEGRFEVTQARTLIKFIGGPEQLHRRLRVHADRVFPDQIFDTGEGVTSVKLWDLEVTLNDFNAPKRPRNLFGTPEHFPEVTGHIIARSRDFFDTRDAILNNMNLPAFKGTLTLSDRMMYSADELPRGQYVLEDDVPGRLPQFIDGKAPDILGGAGEWDAVVSGGSTATASWRRSDGMMFLFVSDLTDIRSSGDGPAEIPTPFRAKQTTVGQVLISGVDGAAAHAMMEAGSDTIRIEGVPASALSGGTIEALQIAFVEMTE